MNIKPSDSKNPRKPQQKKKPKKITETYLHNSGLYYLQRYAASTQQFREVMLRKARRSCHAHKDQSLQDCIALIDALVTKFEKAGLLNDEVYTQGMVSSLRRQGRSGKAIERALKAKGVPDDLIRKQLLDHDSREDKTPEEAELTAALLFARKKRLGPFDKTGLQDYKKSLAKMARAGFSFDTSRIVLKIESDGPEHIDFRDV